MIAETGADEVTMSVIQMQSTDRPAGPQSGGAMDKVVAARGLTRNA